MHSAWRASSAAGTASNLILGRLAGADSALSLTLAVFGYHVGRHVFPINLDALLGRPMRLGPAAVRPLVRRPPTQNIGWFSQI